MILHNEYLTDEDLELLISEAEDDLVPAPPEMADKIMSLMWEAPHLKEVVAVPKTKRKVRQSKKTSKKREFAAYCFRVAMSAAAAIAFMFIMPYLPGFGGDSSAPETQEYMDKETYLKENGSDTWQEVYVTYPSREEVLNDKSMMQRLLEGESIFNNNNKIDLKDENGGQKL